MHFARPVPPRNTKASVRFGSTLSPPVTSLAAALTAALVAEPASRPAGRQQPCWASKSPRLCTGALLLRTAISQVRRACSFNAVALSPTTSSVSDWHCLRPSQWHSLPDAAARTRLRIWDDVLAAPARLASGGC